MKIRRALVSVHDKTGVVELAKGLAGLGIEILSTGGTATLLRASGIAVRDVSDVTGFPEMMDGRVKTLHPKIHGGILARRDAPEHLAALERHGIPPIDLVVVALYPFEQTVAKPGVTAAEAIEQIDVGGPTMIRAAAKNHAGVAVVTDSSQYAAVLDELTRTGGSLSDTTRERLAREAFARTAEYDAAIARWLSGVAGANPSVAGANPGVAEASEPQARSTREQGGLGGFASNPPSSKDFPVALTLRAERAQPLKYGENPHQAAAFYRIAGEPPIGLAAMKQLHGPELGHNNLLDFSAALALLLEFDEPAAVVIKHTNPCGAAVAASVGAAMERAKASDPVSIYGGIVGVNRTLDRAVVQALAGIFVEILFAPAYAPDALDELSRTKKKCRVFEVPCDRRMLPGRLSEYRSVLGGILAQHVDQADLDPATLKVVSRRAPTDAEMRALRFAWRVAKHAKSNAIVLTTAEQVIGVGAGQMNRVDAARLAVMRAREVGLRTEGTVAASDAFFPFRDGLDVVAEAGATAVIQPGGSVRDEDVIAAADERDIAMIFTGLRHFRH
ncbi:MAG TPA: bifunctional phosphoribosylaminoimidazolecarboxamide formyltransferase/IMP cyclohydrolase [Methylomirabilota bacterium]